MSAKFNKTNLQEGACLCKTSEVAPRGYFLGYENTICYEKMLFNDKLTTV